MRPGTESNTPSIEDNYGGDMGPRDADVVVTLFACVPYPHPL